jgi:hypothetical protein
VVATITTLEKYPYADGVGDNGQRLSSLADAVLKFVWIFTVRGKCQCVRTNGRGCACVVNVGQGTDVEYVPVCGDPQLVVQSLVSCIEAHRDLADPISEEEEEEEDELGEMGQVALVALAKRTGVAGEQIDRARCAADGTHPFSLWAMFRRFTTHEVTESGFWRITTNNAKVLGRSVKPNSNIAHYYLDETGKMQLEVPGRHRVMCRILRVNEPRDRRIFQARLAVVHTEDEPLLTMMPTSRTRLIKATARVGAVLLTEAIDRCKLWQPTSASARKVKRPRKEAPAGPAPPLPIRQERQVAQQVGTTPTPQPTLSVRTQIQSTDSRTQIRNEPTNPAALHELTNTQDSSTSPGRVTPTVMESLQKMPKHAQALLRTDGIQGLVTDALLNPNKLQAHRYAAPHNPGSAMVVVIANIVAQIHGGSIPRFAASAAAAAAAGSGTASAAAAAAPVASSLPTLEHAATSAVSTVPSVAQCSTDPDEHLYAKLERVGTFLLSAAESPTNKNAIRSKLCQVSTALARISSRDDAAGAIGYAFAAGKANRGARDVSVALFSCLGLHKGEE